MELDVAAAKADRRRRARARPTLLQWMFFGSAEEMTQEQGQALTRVVLAALGAVLFFAAREYGHGDPPFLLALAYMLAGIFHLSFVSRHKHNYLWRRYVVIALDLVVASLLTAHFSRAGLAFYPLFLWVMIGNGLRYGQHHMQVATLLGLLGFTGAMASSGFLWAQPSAYIGLTAGLVLMPKFFLVMIDRLAEANIELKTQKEQAEFMATHDVLTGLPNRAYLHTRLEQTLARARRTGNEVAVAFIDLDSFKSINDSYGHEYGDYLLTQIADAMRTVVRGSDTVSRLGGDEFVAVIEDYNNGARIGRVIERLFSCVGRYYSIGEYETYVTWSCGVVVFPRDGDDVHTLLKHADTAMYAAKSQGPNRFVFYDKAMSVEVGEQLALRDDLRLALERNQLEVYYQPIIDASSGLIASAEALLRWNHPQHGLLSPARFIEIAEQSGLINPIGDWVMREALKTTTLWQTAVDYPVTIHVNVSAHQLKQADFVQSVESALQEAGLPAPVLHLEMTESALIGEAVPAELLLESLKAIGVRIDLDDFGTGFSSLSYLKTLPVDAIKIDKSFLHDLAAGGRNAALVEVVLTIGERLDNDIIAEGVETQEQRDWLVEHGCRYLQGHYFCEAVPQRLFLNTAAARYEVVTKTAGVG
jgi:diguanylate cyclase (GGDEF)-like protein